MVSIAQKNTYKNTTYTVVKLPEKWALGSNFEVLTLTCQLL